MTTLERPSRADHLHVIYMSRLAPGADYRAFAAVCRRARTYNPSLGVGGVLLFDGERFCQWLHGDPSVVQTLMATIAQDHRHTDLQLLHCAAKTDEDSDSRWCCGFVLPDALDILDSDGAGRHDAVGSFTQLLVTADLEPSAALNRTPAPAPARYCIVGARPEPSWPLKVASVRAPAFGQCRAAHILWDDLPQISHG